MHGSIKPKWELNIVGKFASAATTGIHRKGVMLMKRIILRSTLFAAVAILSVQVADAQDTNRANAYKASTKTKANAAAMHPAARVPGDGLDGVGYGHDYQYTHNWPDVGYNYYGHPGTGVETSSMYPAPHPTPAIAGHTMYTYQPLMPHEHMYAHKRTYYTPYAGADSFYRDPYCNAYQPGMAYNKTTVNWQSGNNHFAPSMFGHYALDHLAYKMQGLKYSFGKRFCDNGNCR